MPRRQPAHPRMVKPSGPRRSAPEVELCIPVIDEESTKGRRISMMITMHLLMDAPKSTLGPIGWLGDDLHDAHQAMASNMLGYIRNHWEGGYYDLPLFGGAVSKTLRFGANERLCCCWGCAMSSFLSAVSSLMLPPLHVVLAFLGIALCLFQGREKCLGPVLATVARKYLSASRNRTGCTQQWRARRCSGCKFGIVRVLTATCIVREP